MKSTNKLIIINLLIFVVAAIGITYFYISNHLLSNISEIESQSIIDIFLQIGCVGGLIPVIFFSLLQLSRKKIANKTFVTLITILLSVLLIVAVYQFILYMTFHDFPTPVKYQKIG